MDIHGKYTEVIIKWFKEIEEKTITVQGKETKYWILLM